MEFEINITTTKIDTLKMYIEAESSDAALGKVQTAVEAVEGPVCDVRGLAIDGHDVEVLHQEWTDEFELEATRLKGLAA